MKKDKKLFINIKSGRNKIAATVKTIVDIAAEAATQTLCVSLKKKEKII